MRSVQSRDDRLRVQGPRGRSRRSRALLPGLWLGFALAGCAALPGVAAEDGGGEPMAAAAASSGPSRQRIDALIAQAVRRHAVEAALVRAVVAAESDYDPAAVSRAGARGLMQLMPETARDYGVADRGALHDARVNLDAGVRHLKRLMDKYRGDHLRVLMAYNAGEGELARGGGVVRYPETLAYAEAVLTRYRRLGGEVPVGAALERLEALRGEAPPPAPAARQPSAAEQRNRALLRPVQSPRLAPERGGRLQPRSPARSPGSARAHFRGAPRPHAARAAIDPTRRDYARPGS